MVRPGARLTDILGLPARIDSLSGDARARADRLLDARLVRGVADPPAELEAWLTAAFGSVDAVRSQPIVKVTNLATLEATLFAPLRARRPVDGVTGASNLDAAVAETEGDPFCSPETGTPANAFGRVRGRRMVTGANAAMADANHAVLVFDSHDPRDFDAGLVADLLATGRAWAEKARALDATAVNYLLIWNCLWRAGGSIVHGHAQALAGSNPRYSRIARFERDAAWYHATHDADLVADLVALHHDLGLAIHGGSVTTLAHVTPIKEREILVVGAPGMDERDPAFSDAVAQVLIGYRDRIGVTSFNLALWRPPLGSDGGPPPIVRLVDRGDVWSRPSDIGAMELYGSPLVGADPYDVARAIFPAV